MEHVVSHFLNRGESQLTPAQNLKKSRNNVEVGYRIFFLVDPKDLTKTKIKNKQAVHGP